MITTTLTGNLGNHMWCYALCRIIAEKLGYDWGVDKKPMHDYHSGQNQMYFMNIDFGKEVILIGKDDNGLGVYKGVNNNYSDIHKEHKYNGDACLINMYDSNVFNINDNTRIQLISQSEDYLIDRKDDICNWFSFDISYVNEYENDLVKNDISIDDELCVINFRGGEYKSIYNLIPSANYWKNCIDYMKKINPNMRFIIISDDIQCASSYIPDIPCYHFNIGLDFYIVNKSKYKILSNSSFGWWAAWLNKDSKFILAPKYWSRHNVSNGYWSLGDSYTRDFNYMGRDGVVYNFEECKSQALEFYKNNNLNENI